MERLTTRKCGEFLVKYNDGEYRSPCFGCESINKCNPEKVTCGFYKALEKLEVYEDIGLTPEQLREIDRLYAEKCEELAELEKSSFSGIEMVKIWAKLKKLKEYEELEKQGKLEKIPCMSEEKYTIEQIIDAIIQSYDDIVCAVQMEDRNMLEDVLKDYLHC